MFGFELNIAWAMASIAAEQEFEKAMATLPADVAATMRRERAEAREKQRERDDIERRHRELCEAIRSTSFWRFRL